MLFQPTNVIPSSFAGVGGDLIDADDGMTISWQVNGTSPMTGYKITIYRNNSASTQLYTTGQVDLSSPFYGVDGMGNIQRFSVEITADTLESAGITNGTADGYKFKITQYWSGGSVEQTTENYFTAQITHLGMSILTSSITAPTATLTGDYFQPVTGDQGLEWARWIIETGGTVVEDSGNIHTQELSYTYSGFLNDTEYTITLSYQMQSGYTGSVSKTITTSWTLTETRISSLEATALSSCDGVLIKRSTLSVGNYISSGIPITDIDDNGVLTLSSGELTWGDWAETYGNTIIWKGSIPAEQQLKISVTETGGQTYEIYLGKFTNSSGYGIAAYIGSLEILKLTTSVPFGQTILLAVYASEIFLYLADGTLVGRYNSTQPFFSATDPITITLTGRQTCEYFGIAYYSSATALVDAIPDLLNTSQPDFDENWIFLSNWKELSYTYIGSITTIGTGGGNYIVDNMVTYRENVTDGTLIKLCETANPAGIIDYGVESGKAYRYFQTMEVTTEGSTRQPRIASVSMGDEFVPICFWNWIVDTGVWDDERGAYEYTGSYIFGLNLETDAFDNGNNPNLLQNFTQYPTRQGTNQNYLSGQLTAYLGHIDTENNVYIDTAAEAEAIRALSTSTDTKFLRSRKGERWMIDTSGPIRLSLGDKYREQPYTVSLPWVQVGDASGAALISLPTDEAWEDPTTVPTQNPYITINGVKYIPVSGTMGINGNQYNF